ncbi:MAG: Hsp20/alpha crystallin family protein [Candidatus Zambryskibacteria bacterium]|nr:Hsp20/alpha crystallin family protein [Candidatus Zambryskibacteria bacterium]
MKNKRSFFERITGAVRLDEDEEEGESRSAKVSGNGESNIFEESEEDAQLTVDVYQTSSEIVVKTMVAGVRPEDIDVQITRDSVTIYGERSEERTSTDDDYIHRELYWGSFSRTISLPEEISVDEAEAVEKHGVLILHLPKLDKNRQTKLKVKGN